MIKHSGNENAICLCDGIANGSIKNKVLYFYGSYDTSLEELVEYTISQLRNTSEITTNIIDGRNFLKLNGLRIVCVSAECDFNLVFINHFDSIIQDQFKVDTASLFAEYIINHGNSMVIIGDRPLQQIQLINPNSFLLNPSYTISCEVSMPSIEDCLEYLNNSCNDRILCLENKDQILSLIANYENGNIQKALMTLNRIISKADYTHQEMSLSFVEKNLYDISIIKGE